MSAGAPEAVASTSDARARANRRTLWLLLAVFVLPVAAAYVWFFNIEGMRPGGTVNRGTLIDPAVPIEGFRLASLEGATFTASDLEGKWSLVTFVPSRCDAACEQNLYHMRQVRIALNKDMGRVRRLAVLTDTEDLAALRPRLDEAYPGMTVLTGEPQAVDALRGRFVGTGPGREDWIFLVDPLGNLMMGYAPDTDPRGMLKDLRKLLKYSQVG